MKEQSKKVANLKHKEQVDKKKNAQLLEEARRREDNLADGSHQLQVRHSTALIWIFITFRFLT